MTVIKEIAARYASQGLSVLPIRTDGSKGAACKWKIFQSRIPTSAELDSLFTRDVGVGVIGGKVSGNLEVLDFDKIGIFEEFAELIEQLAPGFLSQLPRVRTPSGGYHVYYRCSVIEGNQDLAFESVDAGDGRLIRKKTIETRGEGGYVVGPGSPAPCHPAQRLYEHVDGPPITETPTIAATERLLLLESARSLNRWVDHDEQSNGSASAAATAKPGDEFAERTSWQQILEPHGWTLVSSRREVDYWRRPGKDVGVSATTGLRSSKGNELFCVFSSNAHPFDVPAGSTCGTYTKFAAYARLNHAGDFAAAARELASKGFGTCSRSSNSAAHDSAKTDPTSPEEIRKQLGPSVTYERITAAELDEGDYSLEFLIDRTLTAGQPLVVAGGKKQLKTNVLLDAAISLVTGADFLGALEVTRCARVAVMSGESGLATIQETCRRICAAKGYRLRDLSGLIFSPDVPRLGNAAHSYALEQFLTADEIEVLILDPAYLMMPGGDAGNLFIQGELLRSLSSLCESMGVTLIICHHTKKTILDPYLPPELEDIAWAGFQEFCRQWWLLGRRERYEPGSGSHRLWLNVGGSAGHSALWGVDVEEGVFVPGQIRSWDVQLRSAAEVRTETSHLQATQRKQQELTKREADLTAVAKALDAHPGGATKTTLREFAGMSGTRFGRAMAIAVERGIAETCEVRVGNHVKSVQGYRRVKDA